MQSPAPELPPMRGPSPAFDRPLPPFDPPPPPKPLATALRRIRQMLVVLAGGGFVLMGAILFFELIARPGLRPTDLMAMVESRIELGLMNQKLGEEPGIVTYTEAEYLAAVAKAQREGQAEAELAFQQSLAVVEADKARVIGAYQTLFERANMIASAAIQVELIAQQFRQRLVELSNGGRVAVITWKDIFCGIGMQEACASARSDREAMMSEADALSRGDVGQKVRELMAGVEDPATLIAETDRGRYGTPALPQN